MTAAKTVVSRALETVFRTVVIALAVYGAIDIARGALAQEEQMVYLPRVADAAEVETLSERVAALEDKLAHFAREGDDIYVTGANLHVVNGEDGTPSANGLGNVVIGYNEERAYEGARNDRSGSHMLVVGMYNNFSSHGGIVVGNHNTTDGPFSSVSGGTHNRTSGGAASVSGGEGNEAEAYASSICGGASSMTVGEMSAVAGGASNVAVGQFSVVSGGMSNYARGESSVVGGGYMNAANGDWSTSSAGRERQTWGEYDWRAGELFQDQ